MGRLVADAGKRDWDDLIAEYGTLLMEGLGVMVTRGKHVNVLQHLMGYLKNHLSSEGKQELLGLIGDYRQGLLPLIVPLTLLKHHLNRYPVPEWVHQQVYLHPYPKELMLRNHVQALSQPQTCTESHTPKILWIPSSRVSAATNAYPPQNART
jgi:uncharacterized protein YbgA (DUF1722 family)